MSDPLPPHGLQHTRLPCPSPSPGVCSNSQPLIGGYWNPPKKDSPCPKTQKKQQQDGRRGTVHFSSVAQSCPTLCNPMNHSTLSVTSSRSPPKPMSIESVMPSNHLILCRPLLLLPSIFPSIRVFSNESALCIMWPKYWSFSFNISPSNGHSGLISFRMDWLDLLAVQGTLNSLLQHHSSKASILWHSAFFRVQLSHSYVTKP